MKRQRLLLLAVVALGVAITLLGLGSRDGEADGLAAPGTSVPAVAPRRVAALPSAALPVTGPAVLPMQDSPLPSLPENTVDAAASMTLARLHGDARAPAVARTLPDSGPTPAELADPSAYARYEARQNQRLYNEYVKAADGEVVRLQQDIARAEDAGIPPDEIEQVRHKLRIIQEMSSQLQARQAASAEQ